MSGGVDDAALARALQYPALRYMGGKRRLLPWLHGLLAPLRCTTALDPFCGTGAVAYLLKCLGATVTATDYLECAATFARATVANPGVRLTVAERAALLAPAPGGPTFIADTFRGIFFEDADNQLLDRVAGRLAGLPDGPVRALATAALCRAALKKQPRGIFTVRGVGSPHDDGRADLRRSMQAHFEASLDAFEALTFDDGRPHRALRADALDAPTDAELVYLDPPYVPPADDADYMKRYHFLEGLATYWKDRPVRLETRVRSLARPPTRFGPRRGALDAFDALFARFRKSTLVLSYSSNAVPTRDALIALLRHYKSRVAVHTRPHRYHLGNHPGVRRAVAEEYVLIAT